MKSNLVLEFPFNGDKRGDNMIYVDFNTFTMCPERYLEMAKNGTNVYICFDDGTELKLERYKRY